MINDEISNSNEVKMPVVRPSFVYKFCYNLIFLRIFRAHLAYVTGGFTEFLKNN